MGSMIGTRDADKVNWLRSFSTGISASPERYFLQVEDAQAVADAVEAAIADYAAAENPETRTRGIVIRKNQSIAAAESVCKRYAMTIKYDERISDELKITVGVTPRSRTRRPRPTPTAPPKLGIDSIIGGRLVIVRVHGEVSTRRKEPGAIGASVFHYSGDAPPSEASGWLLAGLATKNKMQIEFPPSETGQTVWLCASWYSARGESGIACDPVRVDLPRSTGSPISAMLKLAA